MMDPKIASNLKVFGGAAQSAIAFLSAFVPRGGIVSIVVTFPDHTEATLFAGGDIAEAKAGIDHLLAKGRDIGDEITGRPLQ